MSLRELAAAWLESDPDPETRAQGAALLESGDEAVLAEHFGQRLTFGTAGLRGALGPGPGRMNRALVRRVSAGLAAVLRERALEPEGGPAVPGAGMIGPVVVGYDARHNSRVFAEDTARVLTGAGIPVLLFPELCPTPLLAYAVRALSARAGVMVTASHNPPGDNGYKVYGPDGAQIVSPVDAWISARIDEITEIASLPLGDLGEPVPPDTEERYLQAILGLRVHEPHPLRIVYTPLHGVGGRLARLALTRAGYTRLHEVTQQAEPDGRFPTVAFPNPEEPGALDLALALAQEVGADLLLANDPDADRIAVAIPTASGWRRLDGNETGTLLAQDLLEHGAEGPRIVATTVVSSTLLSKIAAHHGARYVETLTGFKWIARAMLSPDPRERFVLGYEEALGVCAGDVVHDKDGLSAAVLVADLASHLARQGRTLEHALEDLERRHGVHRSAQLNLVRPGLDGRRELQQVLVRLRASPWRELAGRAVTEVTDLAAGRPGLPPADLLVFRVGGDRVMLRPSGTEPKLKCYVEVVEPVDAGGLQLARERAEQRMAALLPELKGLLSA
jgi:phosphomannomutase